MHSCPLIFFSFARILLSFCIHVLSFPKVMEMALWLGQGTECNKWLSLNKPSNIFMTLFEGNLPQNDTEREKERKKDRKKERRKKERNKERKKETKKEREIGWISLIGFARSVNVHNSICLAYAKFNGLSCMVPGYRFWGALSLYSVSYTSLTRNSCNTKVVFNHFDRGSHMCIYIIIRIYSIVRIVCNK